LILDSTEESFVPVYMDANEFFLVSREFQELFTLSLELALTTILHSGCTTWNDVEIKEESFDGMIRKWKTAKIMRSVDCV
jgi:hypothetical protein